MGLTTIGLISDMAQEFQSRIIELTDCALSGSITADALIRLVNDIENQSPPKEIIHLFLELAHLPSVAKIITVAGLTDAWLKQICNFISESQYHVGSLLKQRADRYSDKTAFKMISGENVNERTYDQVWFDIIQVGKSIISFEQPEKVPVIGLLTYNQYRGALIDLACLSFGIRVIPIPLNSTSDHLNFILKQAEISHLFIGGKTGIQLWNDVQADHDIQVIALDASETLRGQISDWESFLDRGQDFHLQERLDLVPMDWSVSIMYTSGTTANPKGIIFNQVNIVSKRFARALALPEIGSQDTFLAYLPLFHTFGRYFELLGSLYWGATYVFAESPAFNSLLKDF